MHEDLDGTIIVTRDNDTGELSFEWEGGNRMAFSVELLLECDRDVIRFEHILPRPEERIEVGPYVVTAKEWRGSAMNSWMLVCDRDLIDSEEE